MMKKYGMTIESGPAVVALVWRLPFRVVRICLDGVVPAGVEAVGSDPAAEDFARRLWGGGDIDPGEVDLAGFTPFARRVMEALRRRVPAGRVVTYGRLAELAGCPGGARAVGQVMRRNMLPIYFPCHRVLSSGGGCGGFQGGLALKLRLLSGEGVEFVHGRVSAGVLV